MHRLQKFRVEISRMSHSTPPEFFGPRQKLFQLSSRPAKDVCTIAKGPCSDFGSAQPHPANDFGDP